MGIMVKGKLARRVASLMISALLIPYLGIAASAAKQPAAPVSKTVVVFPLDNAVASPTMGDALTAYIRGGLAAQAGYTVVAFSERLPAIQRVVRLDPEKGRSVSGPFYTDRKAVASAIALGKMMSADLIVVGSVDRYNVPSGADAEMGASAELIDVMTGKTVRTVVVTGHSGKNVVLPISTKPTVENQAVADVGQKVVAGITGVDYQETGKAAPVATETSKKKISKSTWVGALLLSVAVGLLASGGHGGGSGSSGDTPPPPPGF